MRFLITGANGFVGTALCAELVKRGRIVNREIIRACTENGLYTNMFLLALKLPIRILERIL